MDHGMKRPLLQRTAFLSLFLCLFSLRPLVASEQPERLLDLMQAELHRAMHDLGQKELAPYFVSYGVTDQTNTLIFASQGAIYTSSSGRVRQLDVAMRVGSPELDNTHNEQRQSGISSSLVPLEDDPDAIARTLWLTSNEEYKKAARAYLQVKTSAAVRAQEADDSGDFAPQQAETYISPTEPPLHLDTAAWEQKLRRYSALFRKYPHVYSSTVTLQATTVDRYFVSSEGTRILTSRPLVRLVLYAETKADDGMDLLRSETFDSRSLEGLPFDSLVEEKIHRMAADLDRLRKAPVVEPFSGPALLSGRAAAVFFHEVLGHRLEGQRQRGDEEGQTFTRKIGQQVLPKFLSVVDDPTRRELNGTELSGWYRFDEEGVRAEPAQVVRDGVLQGFLMSRLPVKGFNRSNGHGRAQPGLLPVGRQGNLIVTSSKTVPDQELRRRFLEEIKNQGKPYGLYFEDIAGGFTLTTRQLPQSFQILPLMVWRVYADGRPDELVRGVDIIGTPLAALNRLLVTGQEVEVFNGQCGAESGSIPVSAAAPAVLFSEIEVQKRAQTRDRPPILPPPGFEAGNSQGGVRP